MYRQTSFALGRPDSLGPDQYHTQSLPTATISEQPSSPNIVQIVPCMVDLSKIMRKVALELYSQPCDLSQKLQRARVLDAELQHWLSNVPTHLRTDQDNDSRSPLKPRRRAGYAKKQSIVVRLRKGFFTEHLECHWELTRARLSQSSHGN